MSTQNAVYHPWTTYIDAREEARRRGDRKVGTEHLVLALLMEPEVERALGVDVQAGRAALEAIDAEVLAGIGFDTRLAVPPPPEDDRPRAPRAPRRPTVRAVLKGRLPMTPAAKSVLRDSSAGMRRGHPHPGAQHVLASLLRLEPPDPAVELLERLGVGR